MPQAKVLRDNPLGVILDLYKGPSFKKIGVKNVQEDSTLKRNLVRCSLWEI